MAQTASSLVAPDPCEHCTICAWKGRCDGERHDVDHLSLVAGITRKQRALLIERSVETLAALANLPLPITPRLDGVSTVSAERIRQQARIQLEGRKAEAPAIRVAHTRGRGAGARGASSSLRRGHLL